MGLQNIQLRFCHLSGPGTLYGAAITRTLPQDLLSRSFITDSLRNFDVLEQKSHWHGPLAQPPGVRTQSS